MLDERFVLQTVQMLPLPSTHVGRFCAMAVVRMKRPSMSKVLPRQRHSEKIGA